VENGLSRVAIVTIKGTASLTLNSLKTNDVYTESNLYVLEVSYKRPKNLL